MKERKNAENDKNGRMKEGKEERKQVRVIITSSQEKHDEETSNMTKEFGESETTKGRERCK